MNTREKSAAPVSQGAPVSHDAPAGPHPAHTLPMRILGLDVTATPSPRKPLTLAVCDLAPGDGNAPDNRGSDMSGMPDTPDRPGAAPVLSLHELRELHTLDDLDRLFGGQLDAGFTGGHMPPDAGWVLGIDAALAQPLELVEQLDWPRHWAEYAALCGAMDRTAFRDLLRGVSAARPAGQKYLYRACCRRAGAASPMNTVRPPVALMFHAVAPRLAAHPVHVPLLRPLSGLSDNARVALETYPGWLARQLIGRAPYKGGGATDRAARREARTALLKSLAGLAGQPAASPHGAVAVPSLSTGLPVLTIRWNADHAARMLDDLEADLLDALLCAVLAAASALRPGYGLPSPAAPPHGVTATQLDVEGWIAGLPPEE
ncbi:DUF429 domain-containing protein [Nitratidesulfovibrio liaohensis]|uniref:DUF429 domain-containing protein n=1 Tax=Nitratidesulfovibrio liaohensis TaxID=2604158 RepID=A0ABY9R739_9BACT|nr:DUF429 domain-containing protein [Nitratidesulfovibrio liaohensis]WMW66843.1 DUF429 domain-containing protein [Nitratidesulfovibrio liaohensis]